MKKEVPKEIIKAEVDNQVKAALSSMKEQLIAETTERVVDRICNIIKTSLIASNTADAVLLRKPDDYKTYERKWGTKLQLTEFISAQVIGRCMQVNKQQPNMVDNISVLSLERMNDILTFSYTIPPSDVLYNNFIVNKGWLYYIFSESDSYRKHIQTGYLYRVKINGTFNEKIIDEAVMAKPNSGDEYSEFYINDDVLHYTNSEGLPRAININSLKVDCSSASG